MIFFTGDTHFQHEKVIRFSNRPFASVADMNDALVRNWRSVVTDADVVYHLGDFTWKANAETVGILGRLPGTKHLLVGNHDHKKIRNAKAWASCESYTEMTINRPGDEPLLIVLCHYPFAVWRDSHHGSINLHGHSHGAYPGSGQQMDVGVDCTGYTPIALPDVLTRLAALKAHEHRDGHRPRQDEG